MRHPENVSPVENVSENVQSKTHIMVFWESYGYQCLLEMAVYIIRDNLEYCIKELS